MNARLPAALAAAATVLAAGCAAPPDVDVVAQAACRDYHAMVADVSMMLDEEVRIELVEIERRASLSETPAIASAARRMLEGATQGDPETVGRGSEAMASACAELEEDATDG